MSERQLRRRFVAAVGYSPKMFRRTLRFQKLLALAKASAPVRLGHVGLLAGYADQAHMTREVGEFAGVDTFESPRKGGQRSDAPGPVVQYTTTHARIWRSTKMRLCPGRSWPTDRSSRFRLLGGLHHRYDRRAAWARTPVATVLAIGCPELRGRAGWPNAV